jgi:hypothetical protein
MVQTTASRLAVSGLCGLAALGAFLQVHRSQAQAATTRTVADRERGLSFAADVPPADRQWILAAVAKARPEAARLIDEVDGLVTVTTFREPDAWLLGFAQTVGPKRYELRLNIARLDGERKIDRDTVVVHELGHVIDFALVPDALQNRLAAEVPSTGVCLEAKFADCALDQEKFADTFAKWALRGNVSLAGAGYNLPAPASLEDWGAPLSALAVELEVVAG